MSDETTLLKRAQQGDQTALSEIVETHQRRIYNVALRMCGNASDAEDTLQETFLSALKALPRFKGRSRLSTWLYRIASNACLMRRRREAAGPDTVSVNEVLAEDMGDLRPKYFVDWSARPEDMVLDAELKGVMETAIAGLPPTLRIVFIWRDLEGLSTQETAVVLDISESAVKVRLHRARLKLREALSGYFAPQAATGGAHD